MDKIINILLQGNYCVTISTGARDSCNGYGWFILYFVKIIKIQKVCIKCKMLGSLTWNDEMHLGNRHEWGKEEITVFMGQCYDLAEVEESLIKFAKVHNLN
jgi:hypothetical protein